MIKKRNVNPHHRLFHWLVAGLMVAFAMPVMAQDKKTTLLAKDIDGVLSLKFDVGYVYYFAGMWHKYENGNDAGSHPSLGANGVGYGGSLGYTHASGFGISTDYLGLTHHWAGALADDTTRNYNFTALYHTIAFTPSYKFNLGKDKKWGLRLGLGLGFSLSDMEYESIDGVTNGIVKDDVGFIIAPIMTIEYDDGFLHFDINARYIHALKDVDYFGSEGSVNASETAGNIQYTSKAGPLSLYVGVGLGINF
ncbi:MAG: hypothetical protein ACR2NY_00295 [Alphaproteobacteria bacterium]